MKKKILEVKSQRPARESVKPDLVHAEDLCKCGCGRLAGYCDKVKSKK